MAVTGGAHIDGRSACMRAHLLPRQQMEAWLLRDQQRLHRNHHISICRFGMSDWHGPRKR